MHMLTLHLNMYAPSFPLSGVLPRLLAGIGPSVVSLSQIFGRIYVLYMWRQVNGVRPFQHSLTGGLQETVGLVILASGHCTQSLKPGTAWGPTASTSRDSIFWVCVNRKFPRIGGRFAASPRHVTLGVGERLFQ